MKKMTYSFTNTLLSLKCFDTETACECIEIIEEIAECLMKYYILKTQAVCIWKREFLNVEWQAREMKEYILKINDIVSNSN